MVHLVSPVAAVAVGWYHTCALTTDGAAWCWGKNEYGQLGDGTNGPRPPMPQRVQFDGQFVSIAAGATHTCAVSTTGEAWCWGGNKFNQLGAIATTQSNVPRIVNAQQSFASIVAGGFFSCARGKDTAVWCWGANQYGQLGDGTTAPRSFPARAGSLRGVVSLSAGAGHACATTERETWCWGQNDDWQISADSRVPRTSPSRVQILPR